ncbi:PTS sugar transporter subunit IIA [Lactobacillus sp. XV13L]|nr:PTS sugar transporter subunit IIA [Lactobacillus sp. XV13L]
MKVNNLFSPDAVFISNAANSTAVFKEVAGKLRTQNYVKDDFFSEIVKREQSYPTGIDTTPIDKALPNIAVPHTEGEFVNARLVVPVSLETPIVFKNMIAPDQELQVKFLFMILNNDPAGQANILAQIMDFLRLTPISKLQELFSLTDPGKIYQFMGKYFK